MLLGKADRSEAEGNPSHQHYSPCSSKFRHAYMHTLSAASSSQPRALLLLSKSIKSTQTLPKLTNRAQRLTSIQNHSKMHDAMHKRHLPYPSTCTYHIPTLSSILNSATVAAVACRGFSLSIHSLHIRTFVALPFEIDN
jgi:hypothetical protein